MSDRDAFEKWWASQGYATDLLLREAEGYRNGTAQIAYFAWQAAQTQAGDQIYIRIYDDENNGWCGAEDKNGNNIQLEEKLDGCYLIYGPVYTRTQKQVKGGGE